MAPDMFHVTRLPDAEAIAAQGLRRSSPTRAAKAKGYTGDTVDEALEEPSDVAADRRFDELLADAKRAVDGAGEYPSHDHAVFFWPTKGRANQATQDRFGAGTNDAIVAVDSALLPDGCKVAQGDIGIADDIWTRYYDEQRNRGRVDRDAIYELAKDFWRTVSWYDGNAKSGMELWAGCDVPTDAIDYIENVDTGRVLYEPVDENQATLESFVGDVQ